jgi:hypothetical protein
MMMTIVLGSMVSVNAHELKVTEKGIVNYYDGITDKEILKGDILSIEYVDVKKIAKNAKSYIDDGLMIYISNPEISAEEIAKLLSIEKNNSNKYQDLLLLAYSIYKVDDNYIFGNHYAVFAEEGESKIEAENVLNQKERTAPEASVSTEFGKVTTVKEYKSSKNTIIFDRNEVCEAAFEQRNRTIEQLNELRGHVDLKEKTSDSYVVKGGSLPSKVADATWNDTLNVYGTNGTKYGYINCTTYGYVIGTGKVNGTNHKIYDVISYVKAYPKSGYKVKKYSTTINANYTDFRTLQTTSLPSGISYSDTVSLSVTAGLEDVSVSGGGSTSWSYNPESQVITESSSQPRIVTWTAKTVRATSGKAYDMMPGMRIASPSNYMRAGFAEINCNAYIFGITINSNSIEVGGWF